MILLLVVLSVGGLIWRIFQNKDFSPYPYVIQEDDSNKIQNAQILLVGDRMADHLFLYLSRQPKGRKIYNWSRPKEGLHRTLAKLGSLSVWPKIVIYHGASEEFHEGRYLPSEQKDVLFNFTLRENKILSYVMEFYPKIISLLQHPVMKKNLQQDITKDTFEYSSIEKLKQMETVYKIYQFEMEEMIRLSIANKSRLILLTTPLNLDVPPQKVCGDATSDRIAKEQERIKELLMEKKHKEALKAAKALYKKTPSNSQSFYLARLAANSLNKKKEGRDYGGLASVFDCSTWRGNMVFNAIIAKAALSWNLSLFDFNHFVNRSDEMAFSGNLYPKRKHYEVLSRYLFQLLENEFR